MKICVNIVVFLFLTFLAAPTLVCLLEDDDKDVSVVYSLSEEEMHKEMKEVKAPPHHVFEFAFFPVVKKSTLIKSKNLQKHANVSGDIFLPPPEFI